MAQLNQLIQVAINPKSSATQIIASIESTHYEVRAAAAKNTSLTKSQILTLAKDSDYRVLLALISHPKIPNLTLQQLAKHPITLVARRAAEQLENRS